MRERLPAKLLSSFLLHVHIGTLVARAGQRHCRGIAKRPEQAIQYDWLVNLQSTVIERVAWHGYGTAILLALAELVAHSLSQVAARQALDSVLPLLEEHLQVPGGGSCFEHHL